MDEKRQREEYLLAEKAIRGDEKAFEQLYTRNIKLILYEVGKRLFSYGNKDVEDVAQDVVLRMYTYIHDLQHPEAFRSWMYRIIISACVTHNKSVNGRCEDIDNHADTLADESLEARPAKTVEMNEASAQMRELIAALPDRQRQTLFMYYYADMSYEEIAEALGTTVGTVGTNVMKAKRNLKKTMERTNSFTEDTREPTKALGGMAMGSAILSAFEAEVDATVTASQVDAVLKACGARIADLSVAGSSSATVGQVAAKTGIGGIKLAIIAVAAVVGTAAIVASNIPRDTETEAPAVAAVAEESEPYLPAAEIELAGLEGLPSKINPSGATLIAEDGEPVLWRIVDGNDALLASGTGREIDEAVFELSPGVYAVEWIIENDAGERAVARREIEIVEDPTQFARFTDSETEEAPLADSDPDAKSFADF